MHLIMYTKCVLDAKEKLNRLSYIKVRQAYKGKDPLNFKGNHLYGNIKIPTILLSGKVEQKLSACKWMDMEMINMY